MSDNFKELVRYTLKKWYECEDEVHSKTLGKIANSLIDLAHEQGYVEEISQIAEELE